MCRRHRFNRHCHSPPGHQLQASLVRRRRSGRGARLFLHSPKRGSEGGAPAGEGAVSRAHRAQAAPLRLPTSPLPPAVGSPLPIASAASLLGRLPAGAGGGWGAGRRRWGGVQCQGGGWQSGKGAGPTGCFVWRARVGAGPSAWTAPRQPRQRTSRMVTPLQTRKPRLRTQTWGLQTSSCLLTMPAQTQGDWTRALLPPGPAATGPAGNPEPPQRLPLSLVPRVSECPDALGLASLPWRRLPLPSTCTIPARWSPAPGSAPQACP